MAIRSAEQAKEALKEVYEEAFETQNFKYIDSLESLADSLKDMREDVYNFHVGEGYNHFSEWIEEVFGDGKLARDISDAAKEKAAEIIEDRVEWLKEKSNS